MASDPTLRIIFDSFMVIFLGTLIIVGIFFIIRAYKIKAKNFYISGIAWMTIAFAEILNQVFHVPAEFYAIFAKASFILLIVFTNVTFYKGIKIKQKWTLLILSLIFAFIGWFVDSMRTSSEISYIVSRIIDFILASIALDWLALSCYHTYKNIKPSSIAPWVKVRYKILYTFSPILTSAYLILIFDPYDVPFGTLEDIRSFIVYVLVTSLTLIYGISFILVWMMPKMLKSYLNKEIETGEKEDLNEDEIMDLVRKELD